ncbi:hypothetical protein [Streptomyces sp. H23]|uniref:hypothetical protein n=1 Tax=Streptomyces sp. H23 TaxID=2541723 RepID=UPI00106E6D4B|nr:hypothetical protein [Streptomyces sp. H23]
MSDTSTTTEVASQYAAQVAADLESNAKEQERIGAEVATLQERLTALQHDHNVLVNIQQALAGATSVSAAESTVVPSPSKEVAAEPAGGKRTRTKKDAAAQTRKTAKKTAVKKSPVTDAAPKTAATKSSAPTLVDLVRRHLTAQHEPRSAAEVSLAVNQAHPERATRTTVVRNTLEGLVAKQQAQRTKQGSSVYYTAISAQEQSAASEPGTEAS